MIPQKGVVPPPILAWGIWAVKKGSEALWEAHHHLVAIQIGIDGNDYICEGGHQRFPFAIADYIDIVCARKDDLDDSAET